MTINAYRLVYCAAFSVLYLLQSLIVEGIQFQSYPSSHTLPAESGPHFISIMGIPRSHGTLRILGEY